MKYFRILKSPVLCLISLHPQCPFFPSASSILLRSTRNKKKRADSSFISWKILGTISPVVNFLVGCRLMRFLIDVSISGWFIPSLLLCCVSCIFQRSLVINTWGERRRRLSLNCAPDAWLTRGIRFITIPRKPNMNWALHTPCLLHWGVCRVILTYYLGW